MSAPDWFAEAQTSHASDRGLVHVGRRETCLSRDCDPPRQTCTDCSQGMWETMSGPICFACVALDEAGVSR